MKIKETIEFNVVINKSKKLCACGCGGEVRNINHKFIYQHHKPWIGRKLSDDHKLKISNSSKGKKLTEETKQKLSEANKGKKLSDDHKFKISKNYKGMTGKKHSFESRLKMSLSFIKYFEIHHLNGEPMYPVIGKNEISIINMIELHTKKKGISNNHELFLKCGKWPDRYYEKYNLSVEILEPHHFKITGELSDYDKERELLLASRLSGMIYYISEKEFLLNPEKEIQRFENFLVLLEQGEN